MPRFFVEHPGEGEISITGGDARHICLSLRMRAGERLTVCGGEGIDYECTITSVSPEEVLLRVDSSAGTVSEPDVRVTLYQGFPKSDKLETVIEKSVELGVREIVPVLTERSVARPDDKAAARKLERWQRRAAEAAKQCGRGVIPDVRGLTRFSLLEQSVRSHERMLYFYELGGMALSRALEPSGEGHKPTDIGIFIGPEGGISAGEAQLLEQWGAVPVTLGRRILRTETAPIAALACIMLLTGNLE